MAWRWRLDRAAWGDPRAWRQAAWCHCARLLVRAAWGEPLARQTAWCHCARLVRLVLGGEGGRDAGSVDRGTVPGEARGGSQQTPLRDIGGSPWSGSGQRRKVPPADPGQAGGGRRRSEQR